MTAQLSVALGSANIGLWHADERRKMGAVVLWRGLIAPSTGYVSVVQ
jgi:hypothetical protein